MIITPQQCNIDPNYAGYFDLENYLEFIFEGFDGPFPVSRKLDIIQESGIKRESAIQYSQVNGFTIDFGYPRWERYLIKKEEQEEGDSV